MLTDGNTGVSGQSASGGNTCFLRHLGLDPAMLPIRHTIRADGRKWLLRRGLACCQSATFAFSDAGPTAGIREAGLYATPDILTTYANRPTGNRPNPDLPVAAAR